MLTLNWPAFVARLKPKIHAADLSQLNQEDIRDLQRIRAEIELELEKQKLQAAVLRRFVL
jgi:diadenosine tetraphosphate (Ap4A) HIT family hydrolase